MRKLLYLFKREVQATARLRMLATRTFSIGHAIRLLLMFALTMHSFVFSTSAQTPFEPISVTRLDTSAGPLSVARQQGASCGTLVDCSVVKLGNAELASAWTAGLSYVYPAVGSPEFVAYYTSGGGNCCLPGLAVVDVSIKPFFELGGLFLLSNLPRPTIKELRPGLFELSGDNYERNKLGDRVPTTYIYDQKRRRVWEKPDSGVPDYSDLIDAYPHAFLGDAERRKPLLKVIGESAYGRFRDHISVAGPNALKNYRWLVATGCVAHSCTSNEGFLAIDIRTGRVFAMQFDLNWETRRPAVLTWTDIPNADLNEQNDLRSLVDDWLKGKNTRLADGPAPWRVVGTSVGTSTVIPSPVAPAATPPARPSSAFGWTNPNRISPQFGPSYDCTAKPVATQPLAQLICSNDILSYAELAYVIAYQAVRESRDPAGRKVMVDEANAFVVEMTDQCNIPKSGLIGRAANGLEISCLRGLFDRQRQQLIQRATSQAREEAELLPSETIAIQRGLQDRSFLPRSALLDGVFGPATRTAVIAWQRDVGVPETGFGSRAMLAALGVVPPARPAPPQIAPTTSAPSLPLTGPTGTADRSGKTNAIRLVLGDGVELKAQEVFERASGAVYIVKAGSRLGSAVAISGQELLTNCHIVGSSTSVMLEREGVRVPALVTSANQDGDRCVLRVSELLPKWVRVRPYADVKIGERVFAIGTPRGLELSLTEGIVSSKRTGDEGRLYQTSAAISRGSSGGGLFDAHGHLIGITTFMLKDSQSLNFAIAAEEYAK